MRERLLGTAAFAAAAFIAPAMTARAEPASRPITLDEAVSMALRGNADLRVTESQERAGDLDAKATRGNLGPKLRLEANVLEWNDQYAASFPIAIPIPGGIPPITFRDQTTSTITVSLNQPLTGLYPISKRWEAQKTIARAARADGETARAEIAYRTTETYLRLLETIDLTRIATDTITNIEEQVRTAKALVAAGTLIPADQLRTEVQLAQTRQELLRAEAQMETARAGLAATCGLPVDEPLEPAHLSPGALPPLPKAASESLASAGKSRPELAAARLRSAAARDLQRAALGDMLPSVALALSYQHNEGFEFSQPKNAGFIGGFLNWNVFEWGAQFYAAEAAKARADGADADVARRRRDIELEVYRRYQDAKAAFAAISVARTAVEQAREARRVTKALYENGSATTTDTLNAELELERARANDARSTYEALIAYAALGRASGAAAALPQTANAPAAVPSGEVAPPKEKTPFSE